VVVHRLAYPMAQNNKLKRRAQAFMADHEGVTYLNALKAVDEPLHELRDLVFGVGSEYNYGGARGFRIVPRQGSYGYAFGDLPSHRAVDELELTRFAYPMVFLEELVDRKRLIQNAGVSHIWAYRELYRAGLLDSGARALEPLFHHFDSMIGESYGPLNSFESHLVGIYSVNVSDFLGIFDRGNSIPATKLQLEQLLAGKPAGEFETLPQITADGIPARDWTDSYDLLAVSGQADSYEKPKLSIFFKGTEEELHRELEARDLDSSRFRVRDISMQEVDFHGFATWIQAKLADNTLVHGTTEEVLLWGTQSPAKPTILEVAEGIGLKFERNGDGSFVLDSEGKISTACPFHEDTDSFILLPDQGEHGFFMCYSCGRNGSPERLRLNWENPNILDEIAAS